MANGRVLIFMDGAVGPSGPAPCRLRFLLASAIVATRKCAAQLRPCARYHEWCDGEEDRSGQRDCHQRKPRLRIEQHVTAPADADRSPWSNRWAGMCHTWRVGPQVQWPCPENLSNCAQTGATKVR